MASMIVSMGHTDMGYFSWQSGTKKKHFLQTEEAGLSDWSRNGAAAQPPSSRTSGAGQTPAVCSQPRTLSASKLKPGTAGENGCIATDMPQKNKPSTSGGKKLQIGQVILVLLFTF